MPQVLYNSRDTFHKNPFGAVPVGQQVEFRLGFPKFYEPHLKLLVYSDTNPNEPFDVVYATLDSWDNDYDYRVCRFTPQQHGVYFYCFEAEVDFARHRITRGESSRACLDGSGLWQLTVYDPPAQGEQNTLTGGLMYQIFPDRFANSGSPKQNVPADRQLRDDWGALPKYTPDPDGIYRPDDYFGGDLPGITQKLPYLASLGVTLLYLNPIFEAHANHRYNTADYKAIDPLLGTEQDFITLCETAKQHGISVMLDGVFSHTGSDSRYFNKEGRYGYGGAYRTQDSSYSSWYNFYHWPESYESWWGFATLPNVCETTPHYLEFICGADGVARHWLRLGASGWRLDVADELPDGFLDAFYRAVKAENPQAAVLGEVWEDASNKWAYGQRRRYLLGGQLDSVMNYPFRNAIFALIKDGNATLCREMLLTIVENYPRHVVNSLMNMLSSHDVGRAITMLGGPPAGGYDRIWQAQHNTLTPEQYSRGKLLFMLASVMQYTLPGTPSLYYGDEAGLYGYSDPFNRGCYPWGQEDTHLLEHFAKLGALRRHPLFTQASFVPLQFEGSFAAYLREDTAGRAFVAINAGQEPQPLQLPQGFAPQPALLCGELAEGVLGAYSAVVFIADVQK